MLRALSAHLGRDKLRRLVLEKLLAVPRAQLAQRGAILRRMVPGLDALLRERAAIPVGLGLGFICFIQTWGAFYSLGSVLRFRAASALQGLEFGLESLSKIKDE